MSETKGRGKILSEVFKVESLDDLIIEIDYNSGMGQTIHTIAKIRKAMSEYAKQFESKN